MWFHLLLLVGVVAAQQSFQPRYHQASQKRVYHFNPVRPVQQRRSTSTYYSFPSSRRSYQQSHPPAESFSKILSSIATIKQIPNSPEEAPSVTESPPSFQPPMSPSQDSSYYSRVEESLANIQKSLNLIVRYQESQYLAQLEKDAAKDEATNKPVGDSMMMTSLTEVQKSLNLIVRYLESQYLSSLEQQAAKSTSDAVE